MNGKYIFVLLAGLILVFAALTAFIVWTPAWYASESVSTSPHFNPAFFTRTQSQSVANVLNTLISAEALTETVTLDIKEKDFALAEHDANMYRSMIQSVEIYVRDHDLEESDLTNLSYTHRIAASHLSSIVQNYRRFEELDALEADYRARDPNALSIVLNEGEMLETRLLADMNVYEGQSLTIINASSRFGLTTQNYEQSLRDLRVLMNGVTQKQKDRYLRLYTPPIQQLNLMIPADLTVTFENTVPLQGTFLGPYAADRKIEVYLDDSLIGTAVTDIRGNFSLAPLNFQHVPTGMHFLYAKYWNVYSPLTTIRVRGTPTRITMYADPASAAGTGLVESTGFLYTPRALVGNVPVQLLVDDRVVATNFTDPNGGYLFRVVVPQGAHIFRTRFFDASYPLDPVSSDSVRMEVGGRWSGSILLLYFGVFLFSLAIAIAYLGGQRLRGTKGGRS